MCERWENHSSDIIVGNQRRKKLWETDSHLHCSIVGTCLTLGDLRRIAAKLHIDIPASFEDYDVHGHFASAVGRGGWISKAMHKILERKYGAAIRRFARVNNEDELKGLWKKCLDDGEIPGPFWALITHPAATRRLVGHAFGQVHMLSHLVGSSNRADVRRLRALETERDGLAEELAKAKRRIAEAEADTRRLLERHADEVRTLALQLRSAQTTEKRLRVLEQRIHDMKSGEIYRAMQHRAHELERQLGTETKRSESASNRAAALSREAEDLKRRNGYLEGAVRAANADCEALESTLCAGLSDPDERARLAMDLCGSRIVYVGGRAAVVPHLRALVHRSNGTFIHHDGGIEAKGERLNEVLAQGDVVVCPVDCISHGACRLAKRICRQRSKAFVLLRGSSVSAFVTGLKEIASTIDPSVAPQKVYPLFNNTVERER